MNPKENIHAIIRSVYTNLSLMITYEIRWILHKITGSLHKRIHKLQTDIVKTALEFENYKQQLLRLPCGACEHNSIRFNTRSQLGRKMHARDKMCTRRKTSFSISLLSSKLTTLFYSIY